MCAAIELKTLLAKEVVLFNVSERRWLWLTVYVIRGMSSSKIVINDVKKIQVIVRPAPGRMSRVRRLFADLGRLSELLERHM